MEIHIYPGKKLIEIQNEFHHLFPFLKIEFFKKTHEDGAPSAYSQKLDESLTLGEASGIKTEEDLKITGHTIAGKLEIEFQKKFGIGLQVFRKSGKAWILTTLTDDWTLAHQNREGEEDSKPLVD